MSDDLAPSLREHPVLGTEVREGALIMRLAGELDLYNAEVLRGALAEAIASAPRRIVIDMTAVGFVDSTALGVLVEARSRLDANALLLAAPQLETRRTLQVTGLDRHLSVHDSVDDALTA